jgi:hypothetical protein
MFEFLILLVVAGLGGLIILTIAFALLGIVFSIATGVASFLLFKVAPIAVLGWVVLKLVQRGASRRHIATADQRWLDS